MNPQNGRRVRCEKHPSHLSTGFCSFCLLERLSTVGLSTVGLTDPNPDSTGEITEISIVTPDTEKKEKPRNRTTLLSLFHLDDLESNNSSSKLVSESSFRDCLKDETFEAKHWMKLLRWRKSRGSTEENPCHESCSTNCRREKKLERSSSLRCACDWILCCNCEQSEENLHNWGKVWDRSIIGPLKRSLSESWKDSKMNHGIIQNNRGQCAEKDVNVGAAGETNRTRQKRRIGGLGRSRSVHCSSSPRNGDNGLLRFYLTPLRTTKSCSSTNSGRKQHRGFFTGGILGFH